MNNLRSCQDYDDDIFFIWEQKSKQFDCALKYWKFKFEHHISNGFNGNILLPPPPPAPNVHGCDDIDDIDDLPPLETSL